MYVFNNLRDIRYFPCPKILKSRHLNYWLANYLLNKYSLCVHKEYDAVNKYKFKNKIGVLLMLAFMLPCNFKSKLSILNYTKKNVRYTLKFLLHYTLHELEHQKHRMSTGPLSSMIKSFPFSFSRILFFLIFSMNYRNFHLP